ncbi:MAG: hypothetical protein H6819_04840 [Phycisphaerales bacterium]|nr:hypothetical protein [Phycisphaerales bacterium]MCB9856527.1 hypothetical protein [Phycisphaerales bacterium]
MTVDAQRSLPTDESSGRQIRVAVEMTVDRRSNAMTGSFLAECWALADPSRSGRQRDDGATIAGDDPRRPDVPATSQTHRDDKSASCGVQSPISAATSRDPAECTHGDMTAPPELLDASTIAIKPDIPDDWTDEDLREAFLERAAIMEYDGQLPRELAEAEARRITGYTGDPERIMHN